jgi:hypothetical protein
MSNAPVFDTIGDVRRQHGNDFVLVTDNQTGRQVHLFADGAAFEVSTDGRFIQTQEPPSDPYKLLLRRRTYLQARIKQDANDFQVRRNAMLEQQRFHIGSWPVPTCPAVSAQDVAQLKAMKERIDALTVELGKVVALVAESPQGQRERQYAAQNEKEREKAHTILGSIAALNVDVPKSDQPTVPMLDDARWEQETKGMSWEAKVLTLLGLMHATAAASRSKQ